MKEPEYHHYQCPTCERLCTMPWEAAWCLHHDSNFQPRPPDYLDDDPEYRWTRMDRVLCVVTEPVQEMRWVVVEYQNSIGWRDDWGDALPGERPDDWEWNFRIASEPMSEAEAYAEAARRPTREGWPRYMHDWKAYPVDLMEGRDG